MTDTQRAPARSRIQSRISRHITAVVVVSLLLACMTLLAIRHTLLVQTMESSAQTYTSLVALPVVETASIFRSSGRHVLEQRAAIWRSLNDDLESLEVVDVEGHVMIRSDRRGIRTSTAVTPLAKIEDPHLLEKIRSVSISCERLNTDDGAVFRVVAPAVEQWGRHSFSLVADFSYRNVNRKLAETALVMGVILLAGLALALIVSAMLAKSITRDIDQLHNGVRRLHEGRLSERVEVSSGDEIQDLAEAFNAMAQSLDDSINQLREANRELEKLDQAKADLVANVSHELKTPLTALRGYLELLDQGDLGDLPESARRAVEVCRKNVKRLGLRIEDLVQLSNLEKSFSAGPILETVHLAKLLHNVFETLLPRIEDEGIICTLNVNSDLPPVLGSGEQLDRVFLNLLDNARKFTPEGGLIKVNAEACQQHEIDGALVRVTDTGQGIPAQEQLRVFDRFYQVDPSSSRRHGGMGLGLSLARGIVETHGGSIWVESTIDRGSTFFVWLPAAPRRAESPLDETIDDRPHG